MTTHRKKHIDDFEKLYAESLEALSAKDGTGKKYGKPKRVAQVDYLILIYNKLII